MEITIKINGQAVSVEVSYEVYKYLEESKRKTENLSHQKRRHWDMREFDEYIIATECSHIYTVVQQIRGSCSMQFILS